MGQVSIIDFTGRSSLLSVYPRSQIQVPWLISSSRSISMVQKQFVCVSYAFVWMDMYSDGQFLAQLHVGTRRKALYYLSDWGWTVWGTRRWRHQQGRRLHVVMTERGPIILLCLHQVKGKHWKSRGGGLDWIMQSQFTVAALSCRAPAH